MYNQNIDIDMRKEKFKKIEKSSEPTNKCSETTAENPEKKGK
jgi:hypothetical protein